MTNTNNDKELHLQSLIRSLQQDADQQVDMWREVGNAILAFTHNHTQNQKMLMARLGAIFDKLDKPPAVAAPQPKPTPLPTMPYPAYQEKQGTGQPYQPGSYPSTSQQPPWPPEGQQVPTATVPKTPEPQPWRMRDMLQAATSRGS